MFWKNRDLIEELESQKRYLQQLLDAARADLAEERKKRAMKEEEIPQLYHVRYWEKGNAKNSGEAPNVVKIFQVDKSTEIWPNLNAYAVSEHREKQPYLVIEGLDGAEMRFVGVYNWVKTPQYPVKPEPPLQPHVQRALNEARAMPKRRK